MLVVSKTRDYLCLYYLCLQNWKVEAFLLTSIPLLLVPLTISDGCLVNEISTILPIFLNLNPCPVMTVLFLP